MNLAVDGQIHEAIAAQDKEDVQDVPVVKFALTQELSPVAGHVSVAYKGCLLVWGGYYYSYSNVDYRKGNELYVYPYGLAGNAGVWMKVTCSGNEPKPNCGGAALVLDDALYVFGGTTVLGDGLGRRRNPATSMIWRLDLNSAVWDIVNTPADAKVPTPRDKTAAWKVGRRFYFFGGYGPGLHLLAQRDCYLACDNDFVHGGQGSCWNNQLVEFDVDSNTWMLIPKEGDVPSPRAAAGSCYVSELNSVFLFGGRDERGRRNDLYRLDTNIFVWSKIDIEQPPSRSWCTMTWVPDRSYIVMQGGFSTSEQPLDDVWHLRLAGCYIHNDPNHVHWECKREASVSGQVDLNANAMEVDGEEMVVTSNASQYERPSPYQRFWHTTDLIESRSGQHFSEALLVYGGMYQNPCLSSPCLNTLHVQPVCPPSLFTLTLRWYARTHTKLPSPVFKSLYRKHYLLDDLKRFKSDYRRSYGDCSRVCPSLHGMTLKEIFDVLDLDTAL